jgi:hypothetical protein
VAVLPAEDARVQGQQRCHRCELSAGPHPVVRRWTHTHEGRRTRFGRACVACRVPDAMLVRVRCNCDGRTRVHRHRRGGLWGRLREPPASTYEMQLFQGSHGRLTHVPTRHGTAHAGQSRVALPASAQMGARKKRTARGRACGGLGRLGLRKRACDAERGVRGAANAKREVSHGRRVALDT